MKKELDVNKTVAELVKEFPELREVMAEIGFKEILNPIALEVMGRVMTLPKGAAVKGFHWEDVVHKLEERGFFLKRGEEKGAGTAQAEEIEDRTEALRALLQRLSNGESLEAVRADFVRDFASVSAEEIAAAEQKLISGGLPVHEVQRLCDVHSALFHGHIGEPSCGGAGAGDIPEITELPAGHPLLVLHAENEALERLLDRMDRAFEHRDAAELGAGLRSLVGLYPHYGKKETLLMTVLYRYEVTGPSGVMWGVDDEIKAEIHALGRELAGGTAGLEERLGSFLQRVRDMIYKEEKILFPLTLRFFSEQDWFMVYRDMLDMGEAFGVKAPAWAAGEAWITETKAREEKIMAEGKVRLSTGEISFKTLEAILNLLPVDITFIDKDDIQRFFSNPGRVFARPRLALGSNVRNCHPANVLPVVEQLIADFKAKRRDHMDVYRYIKGKPVGVRYLAIYDETGEYQGIVELVQEFTAALAAFSPQGAEKGEKSPHGQG